MSAVKAEAILYDLWAMYGSSFKKEIASSAISTESVIDEFFFVVLGGFGISYEQNYSALSVLKTKGFLNKDLYRNDDTIPQTIYALRRELATPQFEPMTKEGKLRKYRFIETKPIIIASAGNWLWKETDWNLTEKIQMCGNRYAREWLCGCPGFGMKSASWLLRNTGMNDDCAVFDVHIVRFLDQIGLEVPVTLTIKAYLELENTLRTICKKIGVSLGAMDYLLWVLGRNGFLAHVG